MSTQTHTKGMCTIPSLIYIMQRGLNTEKSPCLFYSGVGVPVVDLVADEARPGRGAEDVRSGSDTRRGRQQRDGLPHLRYSRLSAHGKSSFAALLGGGMLGYWAECLGVLCHDACSLGILGEDFAQCFKSGNLLLFCFVLLGVGDGVPTHRLTAKHCRVKLFAEQARTTKEPQLFHQGHRQQITMHVIAFVFLHCPLLLFRSNAELVNAKCARWCVKHLLIGMGAWSWEGVARCMELGTLAIKGLLWSLLMTTFVSRERVVSDAFVNTCVVLSSSIRRSSS